MVPDTKAKINVKFSFTRNSLIDDTVRWDATKDGLDSTDVLVGEVKEFKPFVHEDGVTYTLYKAVIDARNSSTADDDITEVVYEKVGDFPPASALAYTGTYQTCYKDANGNLQYNTVNPTQTLVYQYDLTDQDTNKKYMYLVRAHKDGAADITIGTTTLSDLLN